MIENINKNEYIPLSKMIAYLKADKDHIYNMVKNNKDIQKFLRISKKGTRKRYYISLEFVKYYKKLEQEKLLSKEEFEHFTKLYYEYIECEEDNIEKRGASIATKKALWADMDIVDADIVSKCIDEYKKIYKPNVVSKYVKSLIRDGVYRHIFSRKEIFIVVNSVVEREKKICEE